jgi:plasmid stabilization system protein ParE
LAYRVLYRKRAERDLDWIARGATLKWFDGLCDAIESLREFPQRCAYAPETTLREKGVRQLLYGEGHSVYRVRYRVNDESVQILTILHARSKPLGAG